MGEAIRCPFCGGANVKLINCVGRLIGKVGGYKAKHYCVSCDLTFESVVKGGEIFPERGFPSDSKDLDVLFRRTA